MNTEKREKLMWDLIEEVTNTKSIWGLKQYATGNTHISKEGFIYEMKIELRCSSDHRLEMVVTKHGMKKKGLFI